jgi:hypothetical protein
MEKFAVSISRTWRTAASSGVRTILGVSAPISVLFNQIMRRMAARRSSAVTGRMIFFME